MPGKRGRLIIVTTRGYEDLARTVSRLLSSMGYNASVEVVDARFPTAVTEREVCGLGIEDSEDVTVIVPGVSRLTRQPNCYKRARVVKGTTHLKALVDLARILGLEGLRPDQPGERAVGSSWWLVVEEVLREARRSYHKSWCIGEFCPPSTPPPIVVASDLYYTSRAETLLEAERRISEGADLIVLGYRGDKEGYLALVRDLTDRGVPVAVDAPVGVMAEGLDAGAIIGLSLDASTLDKVPRKLREERGFVILPTSLGDYGSRVESLLGTLEKARGAGYDKLIVDPVAQPLLHPGAMNSLIAARILKRERGIAEPVMLGINNIVELADSDSQGSIPVLSALAVEAGASIIMVGEESWKTRGATLEARIAADMATLALWWGSTIKDLGINLLVYKEKRPSEQ